MIAADKGTRLSRERLTRNWIDEVARSLTRSVGRRRALTVAGSSLAAAILGRAPASAGCKKVGKKCDQNNDCCDGSRCKGDTKDKKGKCRCKGGFTTCAKACCPASSEECVGGACVTPPGGCPPGADFCSETVVTTCGDNPNCICSRSTEGATLCGELGNPDAVCGQCNSSADCASFGAGAFCVRTVLPCCGPDAQNVCRLPCPT